MKQKCGIREAFSIPTFSRKGRTRARKAVFDAVFFATCTVLACSQGVDPQSAQAQARLEGTPKTYACACPPGHRTQEYVKGVCVASFRPDDGPLGGIALALGLSDGLVAVAGSGVPLPRIFVSTNGGADWQPAGLPNVLAPVAGPDETISTGRVAVEFDAHGRLHLVTELFRNVLVDPFATLPTDLYYTSSSDLGKSWSPLVMLPTNGGGMFPRLTVSADRLYVTWGYRGDYRLNLASSKDDGKTWALAKGAPDDCINASEVAVLRGTPYLACAGFKHWEVDAAGKRVEAQEFTGLRLYRLDPSDELTLVASLDTFKGVWPRLFAAPDGALVLAAKQYRIHATPGKGWDKCCAGVARSVDEGRTWSEPTALRRALQSEDGWDTLELSDARLDAWGLLHVIVSGSDQADPANGSPGTDARLVHAVFDPAAGRVLGELSLTPPTNGPQGYYPGSASLAFSRAFGIALWSHGDSLNYTRLEPKGRR